MDEKDRFNQLQDLVSFHDIYESRGGISEPWSGKSFTPNNVYGVLVEYTDSNGNLYEQANFQFLKTLSKESEYNKYFWVGYAYSLGERIFANPDVLNFDFLSTEQECFGEDCSWEIEKACAVFECLSNSSAPKMDWDYDEWIQEKWESIFYRLQSAHENHQWEHKLCFDFLHQLLKKFPELFRFELSARDERLRNLFKLVSTDYSESSMSATEVADYIRWMDLRKVGIIPNPTREQQSAMRVYAKSRGCIDKESARKSLLLYGFPHQRSLQSTH